MCLCPVALSCSHCDIVNPPLQIRRIGRQSAVALSTPMCQITTDVPVSNVRSDTRTQLQFLMLQLHLDGTVQVYFQVSSRRNYNSPGGSSVWTEQNFNF